MKMEKIGRPPKGQQVTTRLDNAALENIAKYFPGVDRSEAIRQIIADFFTEK